MLTRRLGTPCDDRRACSALGGEALMAAAAQTLPGTSLSVASESAPLLPRWEGRGERSLRSAHRSRPHRLVMIKVNFVSFNCLKKKKGPRP